MDEAPKQTQSIPSPTVVAMSPPTQGASSFVITMNANEVLITCGQSRVPINPATGMAGGVPGVEWVVTLSIPVPAANILVGGLTEVLKQYEGKWGKIPADPAFKSPKAVEIAVSVPKP